MLDMPTAVIGAPTPSRPTTSFDYSLRGVPKSLSDKIQNNQQLRRHFTNAGASGLCALRLSGGWRPGTNEACKQAYTLRPIGLPPDHISNNRFAYVLIGEFWHLKPGK